VSGWRERFADFEGVAYLDAAYLSPVPLAATRAGKEALALRERPQRLPANIFMGLTAEVRGLYARLFSCREEQVALTNGAGAGINAVVRGLELGDGDEVVLPAHEFPSNHYPWLWAARRGVKVVEVEPDHPTGAVSAAKLAKHITKRTRVVAFAHVSYLHGGRIDPTPIVEEARKVGAITVVDGSQAAGALPFDFGASGVDAYVSCSYKFLLGPYGAGFALFSPPLLKRMAVGDINWWAVKGSEDFNHLPGADFQLREGAVRFDAHETASFTNLYVAAESLRLLLEATPQAVQVHCRALCDRLISRLPPGISVASPTEPGQRSHLLCIAARDPKSTADAQARLRAAQVLVSMRGDRLRIAPHLYNTEADVDRVVAALA
jgi:selenocysteine lyase/cysteine desulfurase